MGIVHFGIPEKETEWLRSSMNLTTVVEGGTYQGGSALSLSKIFCTVYTIEKSDIMFELAKKNIGGIENIRQLRGDTREHLPTIVAENNNVLFWLDAHWSGGDTYGKKDECPLLDELSIIFNSSMNNFAILVDDARLFLAPPPLPHDLKNWPSIKEISESIPFGYNMIINDDVIYIVPALVNMPVYMQSSTTSRWLKYAESSRPTIKNCIKTAFDSVLDFFLRK